MLFETANLNGAEDLTQDKKKDKSKQKKKNLLENKSPQEKWNQTLLTFQFWQK